jgi:hypothetical protein
MDIAAQHVEGLRQTFAEHQHAEQVARSELGANLVRDGVDSLWETLQKVLYVDPDSSISPKFRFHKPVPNSMYVGTVRGMCMNLHVTNLGSNSAVDTRLEIKIFRRDWDNFGQPASELMMRHKTAFQPTFRLGDEVVWLNPDKTTTYTTEGLAAHLIKVFAEYVQKEVTSGKD